MACSLAPFCFNSFPSRFTEFTEKNEITTFLDVAGAAKPNAKPTRAEMWNQFLSQPAEKPLADCLRQ